MFHTINISIVCVLNLKAGAWEAGRTDGSE